MEFKRIWILNHYAGPPDSQSTRHFDLGRKLVSKGHKVTIFASSFSHNKFREDRLSSDEKWKSQNYGGVRFVWIRTYPYRGNDWRRILNMLSYAWRVIRVGKGLREQPDVIIGSCVHPFAVLAAYILSRMTKSRFFFEVRDLWPQTLIDLGALSARSPIAWGLRKLEKYLYTHAEKIIVLLPYADRYISNLGISREKIVWIPNGADLSRFGMVTKDRSELNNQCIFMYLGAHGRANALDVILSAAEILQKQNNNSLKIVFVGDGPEKKTLMNMAQRKSLQNVEFREPVAKAAVAHAMTEADAFIFNLEDSPVFKYGISSNKLFDYLASGKPIVFSSNAENNPVQEAHAGISVPARSPHLLAQAIRQLVNLTPEEKIKMGQNGFAYIQEYHDMSKLAAKLESLL